MSFTKKYQLDYLHDRIDKLTYSWPEILRHEYNSYLLKKNDIGSSSTYISISKEPIWMIILSHLDNFYAEEESHALSDFTKDIIYAQSCLVSSFRIKDDLFDAEIVGNYLSIVADLFNSEFFSILISKKLTDRFWNDCFNSIQSGIYAASKIDELQKSHNTKPDKLLANYFNLSQLFNIGISAFRDKFELNKFYHQIKELQTILLVISQILDDLDDIVQDYERERYNYVLLEILNSSPNLIRDITDLSYKDLNRTCLEYGFSSIFSKINSLLNRAEKLVHIINLTSINKLVTDCKTQILNLQTSLHAYRTKLLFSDYTLFVNMYGI